MRNWIISCVVAVLFKAWFDMWTVEIPASMHSKISIIEDMLDEGMPGDTQ